jgi:hypothetical protein
LRIGKHLVLALVASVVVLAAGFPARAKAPPPVGSKQWNILAPYVNFIIYMTTPEGYSCCDLGDGRGDFEEFVEVRYDNKGIPYNHYAVTLTPADFQYAGPPLRIDIPDHVVLSGKHARQVCEDIVRIDPDGTCYRPPFNVIWAQPSGEAGNDNTGKGWYVHCYIPRPQLLFMTPEGGHADRSFFDVVYF